MVCFVTNSPQWKGLSGKYRNRKRAEKQDKGDRRQTIGQQVTPPQILTSGIRVSVLFSFHPWKHEMTVQNSGVKNESA